MIEKILKNIENVNMSVSQWFAGFTGVLFIRFLIEFFSNHSPKETITSDAGTLVHFFLFYLAAIIGIACILTYTTKSKTNYLNLLLFGLPILWLAPTIDYIVSFGKGIVMTYSFETHWSLLHDFFIFFWPFTVMYGATVGVRIEIFIIILSIGLYVWHRQRKISTSIISAMISYVFIVGLYSLPGVIYTLTHWVGDDIGIFLSNSIQNSRIYYNIMSQDLLSFKTFQSFIESGFNVVMSQLFFIISIILANLFFWKTNKEKYKIILKNSRPERVLYYFTLVGLGIGYAYMSGFGVTLNWVDFMSIFVLLISWYGAWMFAVHINDIVDEPIDKISNPDRPITSNHISSKEMGEIGLIWLLISLIGSYIVGYYQFFMSLVFTFSYYIYSAEPLRLKRIPFLSSFLVGIAGFSSILAGFYFISSNKSLDILGPLFSIGMIIILTLGTNIRDIKDIEGDKKEGINALPIIFGNYGKQVVGGFFALSFLLMPIVWSYYDLFLIAIPTAIVGYKLVTRKVYEEKYVFYLYFAFMASFVALIPILYWISSIIK